jgi:hypothetical protein
MEKNKGKEIHQQKIRELEKLIEEKEESIIKIRGTDMGKKLESEIELLKTKLGILK